MLATWVTDLRDLGVPTLIGVLVGGGISFAIQRWQYFVDQKRRRKAAVRIITNRLDGIGTALTFIRKPDREDRADDEEFLVRAVEEFRVAFREHEAALVDLPRDVWDAVSREVLILRTQAPEAGAHTTSQDVTSRIEGVNTAKLKLAPFED